MGKHLQHRFFKNVVYNLTNLLGYVIIVEKGENMEQLLCLLIVIQRVAKEIHYRAFGENFWSDHLLADKVFDGLEDFMDEIQENYFMCEEEANPYQKRIYTYASSMMPESWGSVKELFEILDGFVLQTILQATELSKASDITAADSDLLGRICGDLQQKHGFLAKRLK